MQNSQAIVWGIEPNTSACLEAEKMLTKVINRHFDKSFDYGNQQFDAIFFNDVLEHMEYPYEALLLAKTLLANNGVIISSIPNMRHYSVLIDLFFKNNFQYKESGITDYSHLRFFTSKTILNMHEECGLDELIHEGINNTANAYITALSKMCQFFPIFHFYNFVL